MEFQLGQLRVRRFDVEGGVYWRIFWKNRVFYMVVEYVRDIVRVLEEIEKRREVKA
jgi:hypothetical protein